MRLIDAEQATDKLCRVAMAKTDRKTRDTIIEIAYELQNPSTFPTVEPPPVDAIPVVRCKDCKYWDGSDPGSTQTPDWGECKYKRQSKPPFYFCCYAERREVTE